MRCEICGCKECCGADLQAEVGELKNLLSESAKELRGFYVKQHVYDLLSRIDGVLDCDGHSTEPGG